jgi:AcrR family transcriptional regulator
MPSRKSKSDPAAGAATPVPASRVARATAATPTTPQPARPARRRPGAPAADDAPALDAARIIAAASRLLEDTGKLSMRALARELGVDPMAVYHYFPGKDALVAAVAGAGFDQVEAAATASRRARGWRGRLRVLARAYLDMARAAPALTRHLARAAPEDGSATQSAATPDIALRFEALFLHAIRELDLTPARARACQHALVDCIHGHALAGADLPDGLWNAELDVLLAGMETLARTTPSR